MYRLLVYGLGIIAGVGILFSALGTLSYSVSGMLVSLATLAAVCYASNKGLAFAWNVTTNNESWLITALILFCILPPATTKVKFLATILAAVIAIAGKYLVAWRGKHLFNPAALGAAFVGVGGFMFATWWVGNSTMLPFVLVFGLLVARKIRRFSLVLCFWAVSLVVIALLSVGHTIGAWESLKVAVQSSPLIFLGTIMLTEPATMPPLRSRQVIYGFLVGVLFASHPKLPGQYVTPELALLIGNIYSFAASPKHKLRLKFKARQQLSERVYDFVFVPDRKAHFQAGQYMEWTLPHSHVDGRGNRRTFTIASSPTEDEIHLGVKLYQPSSSFKKALMSLKPGNVVLAGQLNGDFRLPKDKSQKLAFVAGGIGITPFRSMAKYLIDSGEKRDIVLYFVASDPSEFSYLDLLESAAANGLKIVKILGVPTIPDGWTGLSGHLNADMVSRFTPDYKTRAFFLSGPNGMVEGYKGLLRGMGVARRRIVTDYFSGY